MILLLGGAGVLSAALGDVTEAVVIFVVVVLNAWIGFRQEYRAEKAMASRPFCPIPAAAERRCPPRAARRRRGRAGAGRRRRHRSGPWPPSRRHGRSRCPASERTANPLRPGELRAGKLLHLDLRGDRLLRE